MKGGRAAKISDFFLFIVFFWGGCRARASEFFYKEYNSKKKIIIIFFRGGGGLEYVDFFFITVHLWAILQLWPGQAQFMTILTFI